MTGSERVEVAELARRFDRLERRLFGEDGDGEGGALGTLNRRIDPLIVFYQRVTGVAVVVTFLGVIVGLVAAMTVILRNVGWIG